MRSHGLDPHYVYFLFFFFSSLSLSLSLSPPDFHHQSFCLSHFACQATHTFPTLKEREKSKYFLSYMTSREQTHFLLPKLTLKSLCGLQLRRNRKYFDENIEKFFMYSLPASPKKVSSRCTKDRLLLFFWGGWRRRRPEPKKAFFPRFLLAH